MTASTSKTLTLAEFLQTPGIESSPAWEYANGVALQKPMPKTRHSLLQKRFLRVIDQHTEDYTALPELRCTFAERSIVPDIAVVAWSRIPLTANGEPADQFLEPPDWAIEILSPDQNANRVIDNLLYCLQYGCRLGWLVDPDDYSVLVFHPQQSPELYRGDRPLQALPGIDLTLTASQIFGWLQLGSR